uniref:Amino acid permease/ SLC12A domain-containing protein n=1 Tax=Tetradesmus obliquus TaxID=3088 RepID=A0A383VUM4_TETOB|eukprot:jgi/Sobl393_1/7603/SZX68106.1
MKENAADLVSNDVETPFLTPTSQAAPQQHSRKKPLTLLPLIALIFFEVSGGPFGTEDAVAAGGPLLVLAGLLIFPLLWSVPEALITAELATAFPENSGYVAWVTAAFGPFWGFQEGFWSWLSGVTDNSIYPVMFADNLRIFVPALNDGWPRMAFLLSVSLLLTYLNYRGLNVVGQTAMTTTLFIITPFLLLCLLAAPHVEPSNWLQVDWGSVKWGTYLNILFWNLNYWDSISCLAGEVDSPSRTFPRALLWAVLLVVASYFLPTLAALGVSTATADWQLGYYGKVAQQVGGDWLAWWVVLAAAASQIGQFQAEMSSDSYQLQGMAERGFLPKALARRSRHGTPTVGILLSSLGVVCLGAFSFVDIVEILNAVYCMAELLEFAAFVWLRVAAPALPRPYKVPLPTWALILMLTPASLLLMTILVIPVYERNWTMIATTLGAMLAGFVLYPLLNLAKERGWVAFADLEFDFAHFTAGNARTYTIVATGELNYDTSSTLQHRSYNAEYVDVVHDGATGIRATSNSMDMGSRGPGSVASSGRGPSSIAGSLGGFAGAAGGSPRSPLAPHLWGQLQAGRAASAPPGVAAAAAAAPAGPSADGPAAAAAAAGGSSRPASRFARAASGAGNESAPVTPTGQQQQQPLLSPAVAAMAATVAAAQSPTAAAVDARLEAARRVNSFRVRLSGEFLSSEGTEAGEGSSSRSGSGSGGAAGAPGAANAAGLIDFD